MWRVVVDEAMQLFLSTSAYFKIFFSLTSENSSELVERLCYFQLLMLRKQLLSAQRDASVVNKQANKQIYPPPPYKCRYQHDEQEWIQELEQCAYIPMIQKIRKENLKPKS